MPNILLDFDKPAVCPLCQENWINKTNTYRLSDWREYCCPNRCQIVLFLQKEREDIMVVRKHLSNNYYPFITWDTRMGCFFNRGSVNEGNVKMNFKVPYTITEEQFKLYLIMS